METSWGPLPSLQENPTEFARVLNDRLGDLNKRSWHALNAVGTVRAELATSRRELEAEVVRLRSEANANVQRVAVGGVLLSSFGLLLLAVGLGLQTAGDLM